VILMVLGAVAIWWVRQELYPARHLKEDKEGKEEFISF
jgi:hypothetical protein